MDPEKTNGPRVRGVVHSVATLSKRTIPHEDDSKEGENERDGKDPNMSNEKVVSFVKECQPVNNTGEDNVKNCLSMLIISPANTEVL